MSQEGDHTWDIVIDYHRCPKCGFITENRDTFQYRLGVWAKEITCGRCGRIYTAVKKLQPKFGPLIGKPQPPEITWNGR